MFVSNYINLNFDYERCKLRFVPSRTTSDRRTLQTRPAPPWVTAQKQNNTDGSYQDIRREEKMGGEDDVPVSHRL